jgi:subtilisin family serine protease
MKLRPISIAALALISALASNAMAQERRTYIVQLADEPAVSYVGGVSGLARTAPAAGSRFNFQASEVQAYVSYLGSKQQTVAALVGNAPVIASYNTVLNGFAAVLTEAEVKTLLASPLVRDVQVDEARQPTTFTTPNFLGLSTAGGLWSKMAGSNLVKGEDIVIGIVDTGIWPESASFADQVDGAGKPVFSGGTLAYGSAPGTWSGSCVAGEGFVPATHCNNKLIGAQFFNAGFIASGQTKHWTEFFSARDGLGGATGHGGHGTHTSSTAGGNSGVTAVVSGITMGATSGIAPRARIATYKICYTYVNAAATDGTGSQNSCFNSDAVSAIDKAVQDGVNVINYSISGSQTSVNDPVEQAFLRASNAGIFVAASAGNSGPAQAVAHISPWLTTVAASTHDRALQADVALGNGSTYSGASFNTTALPQKPLIRAEDAGIAGATSTLNLCLSAPNQLDPAKVAGKVVICTRGTNARVDKSLAVLNAGGVGMVLSDNGAGLVAEAHSVPTVHVTAANGALIKAYAVGGAGTTALSAFYAGVKPAPIMASFSSRGPNMGDANVLKPDLTAPGVDIVAGVSPALTEAQRDAVVAGTLVPPADWASYQGTSMSSPHVAGLAALLKQSHPGWSPAAIKSALMTTAYTTLNDGVAGLSNGLLPWAQGAGHVSPTSANDPGLVYDGGKADWVRYQCKVNKAAVVPASDCTFYGTLDETYNLNQPSITVSQVVGTTTVTRKVTNVGGSTATYTATASVPGFTTMVTPASLTIDPGVTKTFTVKLTGAGAVDGVWGYGKLVWTDGSHIVTSPVNAKLGKSITAPALLTATTPSGSRLITIGTNFAGRPSANKGGLKDVVMGASAALTGGAKSDAQLKTACAAGVSTADVKVYPVTIPAGTLVARFALRDADVGTVGDDNDMGLLAPDGSWVYSGNDGSNEAVELAAPAAGNYKVCVAAYAGAASMTHKLSSWVVTPADVGGSFTVMLPGTVYVNGTATVGIGWRGLANGSRYVGGFQLKDAGGAVQTTTVVRVETNGGVPLSDNPRDLTAKALSKLD